MTTRSKRQRRSISIDDEQCSSKRTLHLDTAQELDDADIAEALLDLGNAPTGSPRSSAADLEPQCTDLSDHEFQVDEVSKSSPGMNRKHIPTRCKCGKRVSADHPPCKSELMLLCERFQERFCHLSTAGVPTKIDLNEVTEVLNCGRRRLYDITIAYEAAEVLQRTGKLAYVWKGTAHLPELIKQLRSEEAELGAGCQKVAATQPSNKQGNYSMWTLSRKLMRLLLTTEGSVSLSDAADHLIGDSVKGPERRQTQMTVERRLYDIGSILSTLNLITRSYADGKRQPSFAWRYICGQQPSPVKRQTCSIVDRGMQAASAFMPCHSPKSPSLDSTPCFKRKHSDDTSSGVSTATDLGMSLLASFKFPFAQASSHFEQNGLRVGSPGVSSTYQGANLMKELPFQFPATTPVASSQLSLPMTFPALTLPSSWTLPPPRVSSSHSSTLCKPQATRGPVSMQF